jgi:hypothetical protein
MTWLFMLYIVVVVGGSLVGGWLALQLNKTPAKDDPGRSVVA